MKTRLPGKADQLQECVAFAMERCKAHGLVTNGDPVKTENGFSIRLSCGNIAIFGDGNDLIVDSKAETTRSCVVMSDPAPLPIFTPIISFFEFIGDKMLNVHANRVLKTIHSEIAERFVL